MEKIKEDKKTRQIVWLCDMCGNTGKSIFTDILEEHPKYECLTLKGLNLTFFILEHFRRLSDDI